MMTNLLFIGILTLGLGALLAWGFRVLPGERWQVLAAVPLRRDGEGRWQGVILTYYGVFLSGALIFSVALAAVLLGAIGAPAGRLAAVVALVCAICIPSASLMALWVEGKRFAFTVGGAAFVGVLAVPWAVALVNLLPGGAPIAVLPAYAAIGVAYAFGEGIGRLACISFGCCYGCEVAKMRGPLRRVFERWHFVFHGATRKVAYAADLEGRPVVPIQAITATLYIVGGLVALGFFLGGQFAAALLVAGGVTQLWRVLSELLRADFRGGLRFTVYQRMSLLNCLYIAVVAWLLHGAAPAVDLAAGLRALWNPWAILGLQALFVAVFLHTGRSNMTGSTLAFHVHRERV